MARVLVVQDDVGAAVIRAADVQQEAEEASERAARAENTAAEIRQSNRGLLERMRMLKRQFLGSTTDGNTASRDVGWTSGLSRGTLDLCATDSNRRASSKIVVGLYCFHCPT
ncbi:unnamed protein product [Peronospora destructor]|uniref:Uncharacterized protein n=1 Tax=Peronospora destructor TaxID=86335 RepID=A0AAV0V118_9STRA|nr:unnamed protein product [Peronospora destructor]